MARNFLGFDQRGMLGFDLGDGAAPAWLPPTPDTTREAMRIEAAQGRDPAAVLRRQGGIGLTAPVDPAMAAAIPAAPSATGPTALAQGSAPGRPSVVLDVAPAPTPTPTPATGGSGLPQIPAGTKLEIRPGGMDVDEMKSRGMSQPQIDRVLAERDRQIQATGAPAPAPAAAPAAPAGPALSAGDPSKGLVPTPAQGGGAPSGPRSNLNPAEQELDNLRQAQIAAELRKRASGGTVIKGGKQQTGEQWQGALGPNADTVEAIRANAQEAARMQKIQAEANAKRDEAVAKIGQEQADYEAKAAEIQAQIAQRKQQALDGIGGQIQALQQKIASAEIDDGRWWGSKKASDKALVGIAVALDGLVRGLTGRVGQPNAVLQEVYRQQDRDIDMQLKNVEKQRGDLNDLQRVYVQTKEQFGDEALAADAAKLAGLAGFKAKIVAEAAKADAVQATDPVFKRQQLAEMAEMEAAYREAIGADTPSAQRAAEAKMQKLASMTRSYSVRAKLLELDADRKVLEQQATIEERMNGTLAKSFGFTQDRYVGGSSGPSLDKVVAIQEKRAKDARAADDAASKGDKDEKAIFVDGRAMPVGKGASQGSVDKAQDLITFADQGLDMVASAEKRAKEAGGFAPGDPRLKIAAAGIASVLSNAQGGGAPNDAVMQTINDALSPGPRQQAAIQELRGEFQSAKRRGLQRVGAGKLWPSKRHRPSRCTTPRRGRRYRSRPTRRVPSSARGAPPSRWTRTSPWSAPMAESRPSRAARRPSGLPAPRVLLVVQPPKGSFAPSSSRRNSAASVACSEPRPQAPRAGPRWASAT